MKNNTVRVHRKGGKNTQSPQAQRRTNAKPTHAKFKAFLDMAAQKGGGKNIDICLTKKQMAAIERDTVEKGCGVMDWLACAVQTKADALTSEEFHMPATAAHHACLAVYDRENQIPVMRIQLNDDEVAKLFEMKNTLFFKGNKSTDIVADCIRQHLLNRPNMDELNGAFHQVRALFAVLMEVAERSGVYTSAIRCGIQDLTFSSANRLEAAIENAVGAQIE